jgi:hypothetical protein
MAIANAWTTVPAMRACLDRFFTAHLENLRPRGGDQSAQIDGRRGDAMATALDWKPDPFQPHSVLHAESAGRIYSVTTCAPDRTGNGAYAALAGDVHLGRFPCTEEGKRAALTACESHAAFLGDSQRAQAEISGHGEASAQPG